MAVPEFYRFIRPVLELLADGRSAHWTELRDLVAERLELGPEDRQELLPSGNRTRVDDRTQWALTYLRQACLIEPTGRGTSRISARGVEYLRSAPDPIKPSDLRTIPEFRQFAVSSEQGNGRRRYRADSATAAAGDAVTPEESISAAFELSTRRLAEDLIDRINKMPPEFFERLIVDLMLRLGYGGPAQDAGQTLGRSGDGGVDGVIKQDKLGLEKVYLQAKRWTQGTVGRKEVQAFVGALSGQGATRGVFITTAQFSADAKEYAASNHSFKLSLVDGNQLARLMIECDLGVSLVKRYDVKRIDSDFFEEAPT